MKTKLHTYAEGAFTVEGAATLEERNGLVSPWKISAARKKLFPFLNEGVAQNCSGIRIVFDTDASYFILHAESFEKDRTMDLLVDGAFFDRRVLPAGETSVVFDRLPERPKQVQIWPDQSWILWIKGIETPENASIDKTEEDNRKRWVHYGSSISHTPGVGYPSDTWTARTSRALNVHMTNLGMNGSCMLEPMMGTVIRDLPADLITLALGINVDVGHLTNRTFAPSVIGLVEIIREKHAHTPLVLISPIISPPRETREEEGSLRLNLTQMRTILRGIVNDFRFYGDDQIYYIDGLDLFGKNELQYLPDELHPNEAGQPVLSEHFVREIRGLDLL